MASRPRDTTAAADAVQVVAWRAMSGADRLRSTAALCDAVDAMARLGIRRSHPDAAEDDVLWHLADRRYGSALADAAFGPRSVERTG